MNPLLSEAKRLAPGSCLPSAVCRIRMPWTLDMDNRLAIVSARRSCPRKETPTTPMTPSSLSLLRGCALVAASACGAYAGHTPLLDLLDEALLGDVLEQYATHEASGACATGAATSFTLTWSGRNAGSEFNEDFLKYEESLFQARMSHADADASRSWTIRVGTGGNMYSHFTELYGETLPPQVRHAFEV